MKISYSWLKDYIDINHSPEELSVILTYCGLEVEATEIKESVKGGLKNVYIGEVKECYKHPNADKLSVTKVDIGSGELLPIVCGAPNVKEKQKVVVAVVGSTLYTNKGEEFPIKKVKIRGEESMGMICAEDEIGIGDSHEGIIVLPDDAKIGTPASKYFNVKNDVVFEIGLTPNRVDAASHIGTARDVAAVLNAGLSDKKKFYKIKKPDVSGFKPDNDSRHIDVIIEDTDACPRYSGITVSGITVKESPEWLKFKLQSIGLKPINNIVDITNFILHELGQPLHAFDADKVNGDKIVVRKTPKGQKFITLDEQEIELNGENLMICNTEAPMCMAGILGGVKSGVTHSTKNIFIESAYFHPSSIRKSSKHHDIKTDASFRYERGTDPNITVYALKRAALLVKEIAGGEISSNIVDNYPEPVKNNIVNLRYDKADKLIGKKIERQIIKNILESLEIKIIKESDSALELEIPAFKVDVYREADVIEEILRVYGYNKIEVPEKFNSSIVLTPKPDKEAIQETISEMLCGKGFVEIMNNSLTKADYYKELFDKESIVPVVNPLSQDLNVMRQTLLFGGLETIAYNINRKKHNMRLYEFGNVYSIDKTKAQDDNTLKKYRERTQLAIFLCGADKPENWYTTSSSFSFFDLKAGVVSVISRLGLDSNKIKSKEIKEDKIFSNGLELYYNDKLIAAFGQVVPNILKSFDIKDVVWHAVLEWDLLVKYQDKVQVLYKEIPKFPEVKRDLALLIDKKISFAQIEELAYKTEKKILKKVSLFDVFQDDEKTGKDKKSYAVSFILQDDKKTLTDKEIDKVMNSLTRVFEKDMGAVIR